MCKNCTYCIRRQELQDGNEVLQTTGKVTAEEAKVYAETEFEKYRIVQDRLFQNDFDKYLGELPFIEC